MWRRRRCGRTDDDDTGRGTQENSSTIGLVLRGIGGDIVETPNCGLFMGIE